MGDEERNDKNLEVGGEREIREEIGGERDRED